VFWKKIFEATCTANWRICIIVIKGENKRKEKKEKLPLHPFNLSVTHQICSRNRDAKLNFEYRYL
jgi:hypothetical protein